MPSTLSETSTWGSTVTIPSAGDLRNVSSVNTPIGTLANRTQRLRDSIAGRAATWSWTQPAATYTQHGTTRFTASSTNNPVPVQTDVGGAGMLWFPILNLPILGTLSNITLYLRGGHVSTHSALPATMPKLSLVQPGASPTVIATATDSSASVGAYDAQHTIVLSPALNLASITPVALLFEGETGANSVTNALALYYFGFTVTGSP
jgi:hypothetical protein